MCNVWIEVYFYSIIVSVVPNTCQRNIELSRSNENLVTIHHCRTTLSKVECLLWCTLELRAAQIKLVTLYWQ